MKHRFNPGDFIRYSNGTTALMRISTVQIIAGQIRYYGKDYWGQSMGAYESQCSPASLIDVVNYCTDPGMRRLEQHPYLGLDLNSFLMATT